MASCPNCGRTTLRTKDWACQWCGYPLISRAFKKIDKTFKELQEERSLGQSAAATEDESGPEPEYEREAEPESEREPEPPPKPVFRHRTPNEPPAQRNEPPGHYEPPPPRPVEQRPPVQQPPPVQPLVQQPSQPPPVIHLPPPQPENAAAPAAYPSHPQRSAPVPEIKPEIRMEPPQPAPLPPIRLDAIQEGVEITVDQIDAIFRTEKSAVSSRLAGKTVLIRGIVEKVFIREHLEIRYIMLTGTQKRMVWSLRCSFNKEETPNFNRLSEGQDVLVRGKYDGYGKNIIFKDCALV